MSKKLTRYGRTALVFTLAGFLLSVTLITGQDRRGGRRGAGNQRPERNLKILPKDISKDDLQATMKSFTQALGVRCDFCHVGEGDDLRQYKFGLDDKDHKITARLMMNMVNEVNGKFMAQIKDHDGESPQVTCISCHRGKSEPEF